MVLLYRNWKDTNVANYDKLLITSYIPLQYTSQREIACLHPHQEPGGEVSLGTKDKFKKAGTYFSSPETEFLMISWCR